MICSLEPNHTKQKPKSQQSVVRLLIRLFVCLSLSLCIYASIIYICRITMTMIIIKIIINRLCVCMWRALSLFSFSLSLSSCFCCYFVRYTTYFNLHTYTLTHLISLLSLITPPTNTVINLNDPHLIDFSWFIKETQENQQHEKDNNKTP